MYLALEYLYRLKSLKDLSLLKQESFLKSCGIDDLSLNLTKPSKRNLNPQFRNHRGILCCIPKNETDPTISDSFLNSQDKENDFSNSEKQVSFPFRLSQSLRYQNRFYGEVVFYSHKKFSQAKKSFLEKLSLSLSTALFFIEQNQRASLIKNQWREIFNSFPQSFCITNEQFQIIRCNQAFQKLFAKSKEEVFFQNLFKLFPFKFPKTFTRKPSSLIVKGENDKVYWKIVCQKLYLKEETNRSFLFLIKDISTEMEFETKISAQSKNQEIGWMKGSLAHELNNPIAGIKTLISVIERELPDSEKAIQGQLKEMQKSVSTCQTVIQNLLSASKTSSHM